MPNVNLKSLKSALLAFLLCLPLQIALADGYSYFDSDVDVIDLENVTFTYPELFIYGTAPQDKLIKMHLVNQETNLEYFVWSGYSDYYTGTFTLSIPFAVEGEFNLVTQVIGDDNQIHFEKPFGPLKFDTSQTATPLQVNASYKINPEIAESTMDLNNDAELMGRSVHLTFNGETTPSSKVFLLWKGDTDEWTEQTVSHLDGTFEIDELDSIPTGYYTAYVYSENLQNNILSELSKTNFNIVSSENQIGAISFKTLGLPVLLVLLVSGSAWAHFRMEEEAKK